MARSERRLPPHCYCILRLLRKKLRSPNDVSPPGNPINNPGDFPQSFSCCDPQLALGYWLPFERLPLKVPASVPSNLRQWAFDVHEVLIRAHSIIAILDQEACCGAGFIVMV